MILLKRHSDQGTSMTYIRYTDYSKDRVRPKLFSNYLDQMKHYLKLRHPNATEEEIDAFVKQVIQKRAKAPVVEAVLHPKEGKSEHVTMNLDRFIVKVIADNNLAPSGSVYYPVSKKESFIRRSIEDKIAERNKNKHLYLDFEAQGKKRESQFYNQLQANAKIFNNAIAGGMRIKQFNLGSLAGFNAITSAGRVCVKQGYSYIERAVNGNLYLPTSRDAITYILNHARHVADGFAALIETNRLYVPTVGEVLAYILDSVQKYVFRPDIATLTELLSRMSTVQRSYVFYAGCLSNLCKFNEAMMREWVDSCFLPEEIDPALYQDIDLAELKTIKGDVIACVLSTNYRRLGRNPDKPDKWNSLKDAKENNPEGVKAFIYACKHFIKHFETLVDVLRPVMQIDTTFSRLTFQHRMARETVPLSDTDSNIFSTQELVRWKRGKIDFSQESYEINAIVTFILSQSLEHVFAKLSAGFGAEGKDVSRISMKNEFLYPILMATSLAKHYLAIATMQEGSLLPNPRKDIKGVGFRSSVYPRIIRDGFEKFVVELFAEIEKGEPIRAASILEHIAKLEQTVYQSITNRESEYLQTVSIKTKEEYADPSISQYFYYELWKGVFEEEFGEMAIPNKCFKIPLKGEEKFLKNKELMAELERDHPKTYQKLMAFMEQNPGKKISYLLIPPFKGKFHPFFLDVMEVRSHIAQVMTAYYHVLDALGIGTVDRRSSALVSDFYDPNVPEIA